MTEVYKNKWDENLGEETAYWRSLFDRSNPTSEHVRLFHERLASDSDFRPAFDALLGLPPDTPINVLDVGAGPLTHIGTRHPTREIRVTAIDPLADSYRALFREYGLVPRNVTEPGEAETLLARFPLQRFDLVFCRNALDHSHNPAEGIRQMVAVTRTGGLCWIEGHVNEGEKARYHGLHQWNFQPKDGDLVIWNPRERISLRQLLGSSVTVRASGDKWYQVQIARHKLGLRDVIWQTQSATKLIANSPSTAAASLASRAAVRVRNLLRRILRTRRW